MELWQTPDQPLPRSAHWGMPIEQVKAQEGNDYYENDDIPYYLSYYFHLEAGSETLYNVLYYFDTQHTLSGITFSMGYDTSMFGNIEEERLVAVQEELLDFLKDRYGAPEVEERHEQGGHERFSTWKSTPESTRIVAVQYSDARTDVKHSLRLDFELIT